MAGSFHSGGDIKLKDGCDLLHILICCTKPAHANCSIKEAWPQHSRWSFPAFPTSLPHINEDRIRPANCLIAAVQQLYETMTKRLLTTQTAGAAPPNKPDANTFSTQLFVSIVQLFRSQEGHTCGHACKGGVFRLGLL